MNRTFEVIVTADDQRSHGIIYPPLEGERALSTMLTLTNRGIDEGCLLARTRSHDIEEIITLREMRDIYGDWN